MSKPDVARFYGGILDGTERDLPPCRKLIVSVSSRERQTYERDRLRDERDPAGARLSFGFSLERVERCELQHAHDATECEWKPGGQR